MKITVVGTGYVGLSNAILLSQHNEVYAVDILSEKIEMIQRKESPIQDTEIEDYLLNKELNLHATTDVLSAYKGADFIIIATPTDYNTEQNYFDTSSIESVMEKINSIEPAATIVIKSTVPVGYTKRISIKYKSNRILFSPEFLREGKALYDNLYPSRIIVGVSNDNEDILKKAEMFSNLLKDAAIKKEIPVLITDCTEAEAIKLFANTYLAMRVAFFNELDTYAELKGLNTKQIIEGIGLDPRIGKQYNNPSFGYGGYCLPKDTKQLLADYSNIPNNLISAVVEANKTRKDFITERIMERNPKIVGIYRITMKTNSDNYRHSSILGIMERLMERGVSVVVYEPTIKEDLFFKFKVIHNLGKFKQLSDVIVANRKDSEILDVSNKVYTRDLYCRD